MDYCCVYYSKFLMISLLALALNLIVLWKNIDAIRRLRRKP